MILEHVIENQENYNEMRDYFGRNCKVFQYIYRTLFLKFYVVNNVCGINLHGIYRLKFNEWTDQKNTKKENVGKEADSYVERKEIKEFEQKSISIDDDKNEKSKLESEEKI